MPPPELKEARNALIDERDALRRQLEAAQRTEQTLNHDGDISEGGDRTLCWVDEETSRDDAGFRACCSIWAQHRGDPS